MMFRLLLSLSIALSVNASDARHLFSLSYPPLSIVGSDHGEILFTDTYAFLGTDGGLYRVALPLARNSEPQRVAFDGIPVTGLAQHNGALYAVTDVDMASPGSTTHSLFKSTDDGLTWTPIDAALEECFAGECRFLSSSDIEVLDGRIFVNAGGNMLVSGDEGQSWAILFGHSSTGKPQAQACYRPSFEIFGERLLLGGECPLDSAYLRTGTLRPDRLGWQQEPIDAVTPFLENRNIQFIKGRAASNMVYVGNEGGLLRSVDGGMSYEYILHFEGTAPKYPYIQRIAFPSSAPSTIIVAGFDKGAGGPFLAISEDDGETWTDRSDLLPGVGNAAWSVTYLAETPHGQIVIGVEDDESGALHLYELGLDKPNRRRAVRR